MRNVAILATLAAGLLLMSSTAWAQPAGGPGGGGRGMRGGMDPMARLEGVGLTDEQKAKAKEIFDAAKAKAEKAEGRQAKMEITRAAMEDVKKNVLTDEQRKKLDAMPRRGGMGGPGAMGGLDALNLTDEQKAKVKTIMDAAREKMQKAESREARGEIMKAAMEDVRKNVLTDEQRKKLEEMPKPGEGMPGLERLNLTDEQKAKVKEILAAAKTKAQAAEGAEAKAAVWKAAREDISKNVLTDEQRKKLEERPTRTMGEPMIQRRLEPLGLTDDQKAKVKPILEAATAKAEKAEGPQAKMEVWRAAMEDIRKNVLTDEQRKKLDEARPARGGARGGRGGAGAPPPAGAPE